MQRNPSRRKVKVGGVKNAIYYFVRRTGKTKHRERVHATRKTQPKKGPSD